jgi:superfamily II DNA or RNA helicase
MKTFPISHSSMEKFRACMRWWTLYKIKGIEVPSDMTYAHAGTVIHTVLEEYYNDTDKKIEDLKVLFNKEWDKFKLSNSKVSDKKDLYWMMVLNSINKNIKATSTELKIFFEDAVGYIDFFNSNEKVYRDHKSSTRSAENERNYKKQLIMYAWLIKRKFGWIPEKGVVDYLKYDGSRGELVYIPTQEDIDNFEKEFEDMKKKMLYIEKNDRMPKRKNNVRECAFFCPYKSLCWADNSEVLKYTIENLGANIKIDINDYSLKNYIMKKFSYIDKNDIFMAKRYNKTAKPKTLYNHAEGLLPTGLLEDLKKILYAYAKVKKKKIEIKYIDNRQLNSDSNKDNPKKLSKELRDYQKDAVKAFISSPYKRNLINMGTGGGKTLTAIEITRTLNMKTLFVVDTEFLLKQAYENYCKEFSKENIGLVYGKEKDFSKFITIATRQTLVKNFDKKEFFESIRFMIVDECHKIPAESYLKINDKLKNLDFCLGITATVKREDGKDLLIKAITGNVCYVKNIKELIDDDYLVKPKIIFIEDFAGEHYKKREREIVEAFKELCNHDEKVMDKKKIKLHNDLYKEFIIYNIYRNDVIEKIIKESDEDIKKLILVKNVAHGEILSKTLFAPYISGSMKSKEREKVMKDFNEGKISTIIATNTIFSEGVDLPELSIIINATANAGSIKTIQMLGRVLRKSKDPNKQAIFYDFKDPYKFFNFASVKRSRYLKKEGHEISIIKKENIFK